MLPRERVPHGEDDHGQQDELHDDVERAIEDDDHRIDHDRDDDDDGRDRGKAPRSAGLLWCALLCHDDPLPS